MFRDRSLELRVGRSGPELVRRAHDRLGKERLRREVERLRSASHPGVVPLLGNTDDELTLAWVGGETLETTRTGLAGTAAITASVAATLADLHDRGIVHGRLEPSHVVIGSDGRPRLCGLRGVDPDADPPEPSDDVAALGRILRWLLGTETELEPIPERRWRRRRWSGYETRALHTLSDQASDPDPSKRPTAEELATAITAAVPGADFESLPEPPEDVEASSIDASDAHDESDRFSSDQDGATPAIERAAIGAEAERARSREASDAPADPTTVHDARAPSRRGPILVLMGAAAILVVVGIFRIAGTRSSRDRVTLTDTTSERHIDTDARRFGSIPASTCDLDTGPDIDGDGCPDAVSIDGNMVIADGRRFRIGQPGDRVRVGDWHCDGRATAGVVRPSTGEVFVFREWADDRVMFAEAVSVVAGAIDLVEGPDDVCETRVRLRDGSTLGIDLETTR